MTKEELDTLEALLRKYVALHATSPAVVTAARKVRTAMSGVRGKVRAELNG